MSDPNRQQPLLVIQARSESQRLPRKVVTEIGGHPLLEWVIDRVLPARSISGVVVATTTRAADDEVAALAARAGADVFRGSADDVLGRFVAIAAESGAESLVRVSGDSPLIDATTVDIVVDAFGRSDAHIAENHLERRWPFGVAVEVLTVDCLRRLDAEAADPRSREHVTVYAYEHPDAYSALHVPPPPELAAPDLHVCVDTTNDLENVRHLCALFAPRRDFALAELVARTRTAEVA